MRHAVLNFIRVAANIISHYFHIARIKKKEKKQDGSYGADGVSLGMCFGLLFGTTFGNNAAMIKAY